MSKDNAVVACNWKLAQLDAKKIVYTYGARPVLDVHKEWVGFEMEHWLFMAFPDKYQPETIKRCL